MSCNDRNIVNVDLQKDIEYEGMHFYGGKFTPLPEGIVSSHYATFSVGISKLVRKSGSKGLKKVPARVRVAGPCFNPHAVYDRANAVCRLLDAGKYTGPALVRV